MFHLPAGNFFAVLGVILCVILVTRVDFGQSLILIATIALLDAPTGRAPFDIITHRPFLDSIFVYAFLLLLIAYDLWSTRKVHRATLWASLFVLVVGQLRVPIGQTAVWHTFATWMQTLAR